MRTAILVVVMLVAPKPAFCDTLFRASMVAAVVAHSADLSVTQRCLGAGRCVEVNPWLGRFEQPIPFAIAKMGVASLGLLASAKLHQSHPKWAIVLNFATAAAYSAVAIRNTRVGQ